MRARVDATHSIITSRQRVEATMTAEISTMRLDIGDIQEALKNHDSWMEDVSNTLQQMQEKEENLTEDIINLKNEMNTKLDTKVDNVAWKEANDDLIPARKPGGTDAQVLKKVSTRLQDFEAQITAQLSNMQSDFDKKLSHVNRGASSVKPMDATGASAGLDTMAEDLDQLKYDVGELKDLLSNNKGEVNHIRRIVLACERDMEDFTAAMDAVNVDLDEMRARVDATHSIITSRQRVEATM